MTKDSSSIVSMVQKLIHEEMYHGSKRIDGEVTHVLSKGEQSKCRTETHVRERRLLVEFSCGTHILIETTYVERYSWNEHHNGEGMKKLPASVELESRNMFVGSIQQVCS